MGEHAGREEHIEKLIRQFEAKKISRAKLIKALTGITTASVAERDEGRKIAFERIMNHTYKWVDMTGNPSDNRAELHEYLAGRVTEAKSVNGDPWFQITSAAHGLDTGNRVNVAGVAVSVDGLSTIEKIDNDKFRLIDKAKDGHDYTPDFGVWSRNYLVFGSAVEHQEWLFGDGHSGTKWKDKGLKQYKNNTRDAVTEEHGKHNRGRVDVGGNLTASLKNAIDHADKEINAFQLGGSEGMTYNFDDLYGLVRLKLDFVDTHAVAMTFRGLLAASNKLNASKKSAGTKAGKLGQAVAEFLGGHLDDILDEMGKVDATVAGKNRIWGSNKKKEIKRLILNGRIGLMNHHEY